MDTLLTLLKWFVTVPDGQVQLAFWAFCVTMLGLGVLLALLQASREFISKRRGL